MAFTASLAEFAGFEPEFYVNRWISPKPTNRTFTAMRDKPRRLLVSRWEG